MAWSSWLQSEYEPTHQAKSPQKAVCTTGFKRFSSNISNAMSQTFLKTGSAERITDSAGGITISVPIALKRRSGRSLVTLPNGQPKGFERPWDGAASPEQLALARGMVWRRMLESGEVQTLSEIAELEDVDSSYVSRLINLSLQAAWVLEAILEG
jgi:hypothetical protein